MKLLTTAETATLLGVKINTLEGWRHYGKGPRFRRLGSGKRGLIRYAEADVIAWVDQGTFESTSGYGEGTGSSAKHPLCRSSDPTS
jgi:hypothetical protein